MLFGSLFPIEDLTNAFAARWKKVGCKAERTEAGTFVLIMPDGTRAPMADAIVQGLSMQIASAMGLEIPELTKAREEARKAELTKAREGAAPLTDEEETENEAG
jgi:hypothetical protein